MTFQKNRIVPLLLSAAASALFGVPPAQAQRSAATFAPDEVLFALRPQAHIEATGVSARIGRIYGRQTALNAFRVAVRRGGTVQQTIAELKKNPNVLYAEPNYVLSAFKDGTGPSDPFFSQQYAPQKTQAVAAWSLWKPTTAVTLAILDTGVDSAHPDLTKKMLRDAKGAVLGYNATDKSSNALDDHEHGTHCAGIAAAEGNNGIGIAGIAGWGASATNYVQIMPVKVLDSSGSGYTSWVSDGIIWATDHGAKVISLSLGGPDQNATLDSALAYAWSKGAIVVAAAGNDGVNTKYYPAGSAHVISVGATDSNDGLTYFSNWGDWVKVAAPGLNIYSTLPNGAYGYLSGTSMACPHVAGEAALLMAQYPALSNDGISALILAQTDPVAPGSHAIASGAGRINVYKALTAAGGNGNGGSTGGGNPAPTPSQALQLALTPATVVGGGKTIATLTLALPASTSGLTVQLSGGPLAPYSGSVIIASGQKSRTIGITAGYPEQDTPVQLTATGGTLTASVSLTVQGVRPQSIAFVSKSAKAANAYTFRVSLAHATTNGKPVTVALTSSSDLVTVPPTVTVAAGASSGTFDAQIGEINADATASLTASANGAKASVYLALKTNIPALSGVSVSTPTTANGATALLSALLTLPAPAGATVGLSSDNAAVVAPKSLTIAAGKSAGTAPLTLSAVAVKTTVTITATYKSGSKTATLTLLPPSLIGVSFATGSVTSGKTLTGTVTLSSPAPAGGIAIALASPAAAGAVPSSVTVPAGAKTATFTLLAPTVKKATALAVTASLNSATKQANATVLPAPSGSGTK